MSKTQGWAAAGLLVAACLCVDPYTGNPNVSRWLILYLLSWSVVIPWAVRAFRDGIYIRTHNLAALVFCSYAGLSLLWSPDPKDGALRLVNLLVMWCVFVLAQGMKKDLICRTVAVAVIGVMAFYWYWPEVWGGFGNENFQAEFLLIALPFCFYAGRLGWVAMVLSLHWLLFVTASDTPWAVVAFTLGLCALWYAVKRRQWFWGAAIVLVPMNLALMTGWGLRYELARAVVNRLELGFNTITLWLQSPLFGNGMGSFNYLYPDVQEAHLRWFPWADTTLHPATVFPGAAHNEYLQALSDYGVVGVGLATFALVLIWGRSKCSVGRAALVPLAATCLTGFPLQNVSTALLTALALACIASPGPALKPVLSRLRLPSLPAAFWERLAR